MNEFGEVGVDGDLLKDAGSDVVELASGCICCSLTVDLKQALSRISQQYHPRRIIIEASGVADPGAITPLLRDPSLSGVMKLEKIVTVLDADVWEAREVFGQLFYNQLEAAHLILLNKVDTVDENNVPRYLEELHAVLPNCQVIPTIRCSIDENRFLQFIKELPWELFRMKGSVRFADRTEIVNFVGGRAEWGPWDGECCTRLAFIGWDIAPGEILDRLSACRVPQESN